MNFIIYILFILEIVSQIHGYNYDKYNGFNGYTGNTGSLNHNPHMQDKIRSSFKRRNILGQKSDSGKTKHIPFYSKYNKRYGNLDSKTHFIEPTNDPKVNEYILNKKLISEPIKIDDDDLIRVLPVKYYDKYSFKDNWANSWKDSDVW
jgi:hypothetical protein|tara:strand:+ start:212 stop:655 length:444 start_codon:yes stop_codon:yes gene_type:complete